MSAAVVAVTGASGNLGRLLVERLLAEPGIERIVAIDKAPPPQHHPRLDAVSADVRDPGIEEHLRGCDVLVHLAFIVERGSRDPALVQSVNVGGSQNTIAAAVRAGVRHVIYASSIVSYGFHRENLAGPLTEDAPTRGNDEFYYARTKAEVERWLDGFEAEHPDVAIARLRPSVFLGPRGGRELDVFRGGVFPYVAGADRPMHLTHEDDVARAFVLALRTGARGAFNLASDDALPMSAWPEQLARPGLKLPRLLVAAADLAYRAKLTDVDPVWFRMGDAFPIVVSSERARRELGWQPVWATTGAVLRALGERPAAAASPEIIRALGRAADVTRDRGRVAEIEALAAVEGAVNLELMGAHPSEWSVSVRRGAVAVRAGLDSDAEAAFTMPEPVMVDLLAGGDVATAAVELRGDIAWRERLGALVSAVRATPAAPAPRGLRARARSALGLG